MTEDEFCECFSRWWKKEFIDLSAWYRFLTKDYDDGVMKIYNSYPPQERSAKSQEAIEQARDLYRIHHSPLAKALS